MKQADVTSWIVKPLVFILALVPAGSLVYGLVVDQLGANPVETITHETGEWGLRFLLLTLAITPIQRLAPWSTAIRLRRMLGLFAFFYVLLHFTTYLWLDHFFELEAIIEDISERPYITAGVTALVAMIPLALTSTNGMLKRLGAKRWQALHRLVYVACAAALLHFIWLVKADLRGPLIYTAIGIALMALRYQRKKRRPEQTAAQPAETTLP
ncbi:MAG: sulfoxide reductase heme-binding subunit YedZ [Thiotrichales bacterium]|nr:sulfoxide reductase heme-binding subunit YedZ [Thiotrichales bacterium]